MSQRMFGLSAPFSVGGVAAVTRNVEKITLQAMVRGLICGVLGGVVHWHRQGWRLTNTLRH